MSGEILLEIKNLSARYVVGSSSIKVLRSVNLKITRGEKIVVVGESGSGKSTLASLIVRLEPDNLVLDSGTALYKFNGQYIDLLKADDKLLSKIRGKEISMVFQNPSTSLNPVYTIGFQVSEALKLEKLAKGQLQEKIGGLLKTVKLPDPLRIARSYPHQLSGGQKQRAMIAIAISRTPKLIITDEPTSSLDVSVQAEILDLLRDINKRGSSIMMITHDIGVAYDFADLVVVMYGGMIV
ncbi:MAG: ABC transporter ATP-binding protein, partial [Desulfurococcaceae archaeon]